MTENVDAAHVIACEEAETKFENAIKTIKSPHKAMPAVARRDELDAVKVNLFSTKLNDDSQHNSINDDDGDDNNNNNDNDEAATLAVSVLFGCWRFGRFLNFDRFSGEHVG